VKDTLKNKVNMVFKVNRCEVFRKANTKDKHMLGNIKNTSQILTKTINWIRSRAALNIRIRALTKHPLKEKTV